MVAELAAPVNFLETMAGVAEIGLIEGTVAKGVEVVAEAAEYGVVIESHGFIGVSENGAGAFSDLGSIEEVVDEVALSGLVHDFDLCGLLGDLSDVVAVFFTSFLDSIGLRLVNLIQLCDVDLAAGYVMDKLGLGVDVGSLNLCIDLCVGILVDFIDGLSFNRLI